MARSAAARKADPKAASTGARARASKISITVDERVLQEASRIARRSGKTLSAHITEALARDLRQRALERLIEEYEHEHGAISDAELSRIHRRWQA